MTNRSSRARGFIDEIGDTVEQLSRSAERLAHDARVYLASPRGVALRKRLASGLMTVSPAIAGMPIVRRSPLVRLLGAAGAATVLVKVAEAIRDWEPVPGERPA